MKISYTSHWSLVPIQIAYQSLVNSKQSVAQVPSYSQSLVAFPLKPGMDSAGETPLRRDVPRGSAEATRQLGNSLQKKGVETWHARRSSSALGTDFGYHTGHKIMHIIQDHKATGDYE